MLINPENSVVLGYEARERDEMRNVGDGYFECECGRAAAHEHIRTPLRCPRCAHVWRIAATLNNFGGKCTAANAEDLLCPRCDSDDTRGVGIEWDVTE